MRETLPKWGVGTLIVVMDNTSGDNKNSYVIGMLSHMVQCGMFKEVLIHHHLVGHTHIDVDGLIGVLARHIMHRQIEDLSGFLTECRNAIQGCKPNIYLPLRVTSSRHLY